MLALLTAATGMVRPLVRFDAEVEDAIADDLLGIKAISDANSAVQAGSKPDGRLRPQAAVSDKVPGQVKKEKVL